MDVIKYLIITPNGYKNLKKEINSFGFKFNIKSNIISYISFILLMLLMCNIFNLGLIYFITLSLIGILIIPYILLCILSYSYYEMEYNALVNFIIYFISIYKINPKILYCLETSNKLFKDTNFKYVDKCITNLNNSNNIKDSINPIVDKYNHFIIRNLFDTIITIENYGFNNYIDILEIINDDIDLWIEDTYLYQKELIRSRNKIISLSLFSIVISYVAYNMIMSVDISMNTNIISISIFIFFLVLIFTILGAYSKLRYSWIMKEECI